MDAPSPDWDAAAIITRLERLASAKNREGMARFGINTDTAFGAPLSDLRPLARKLRRNHDRALDLWATGWREARLLAAFTADPQQMTPEIARRWASDFDSWDIVDGVSDLFVEMAEWRGLIDDFAADEREFVRRAAFAMVAWAAVHRKAEPEATFIGLLPVIETHAVDPRNFVRKAVNWALRQIGKRSMPLNAAALEIAEKLSDSEDRTKRWIGKDAVRELTAGKTLARLDRPK